MCPVIIYFILVSITIIVFLLFYDRYNINFRQISKIPGPKRWPIIGNSFHFLLPPDALFLFIRTLYKNYGGFNQIHAINFWAVGVYNPEDIEKILSSVRYNNKLQPYGFLKPWLGEGLLTSNGLKWHQRRKLLTSAFHFNILKKYFRTFTEQAEHFLEKVEAEVGNPKTDIQPLISFTTLRVMCETTMGTSMNDGIESVIRKYLKAIEIIGESVVKRMCRIWLYFNFFFNLSTIGRNQNEALLDLHSFTNKIIKERKEFLKGLKNNQLEDDESTGKKGRLAMLDLLLENEKLGNINIEGIREEVDTFMFEGHDTTAMALSFFMMAIANEPAVQDKIYEEMQNIFGSSQRSATMQDLSEMSYLECCIKESLRLYPSVPFISRFVTEELNLSGYTVPENTNYHIFIYDLHHRADLYPEPERFIPERFLPENCVDRHRYAFIPFSAGPRNCIGKKFAMLEMKTLISSLIRRFRLEPVTKPSDLKFRTDLVLRTYNQPIYVRFCKRFSDGQPS
ncbi:cytochrome P450 4C1-like [Maniola hyperantus]|uniref:cytochrome P450 4C1-like n=1 Tax=Aphantopus hyperantus TaxID=2795564 RepID=UPI00156A571A|nr:cytochrome P450 4C1-like [Maniola hyperantus]